MSVAEPTPPHPPDLDGGRYVLKDLLGVGGMASVWRVLDERDGSVKAVKLLQHAGTRHAKTKTRFEQEARTMARLRHRNIVSIFDIGHEQGWSWFVMDLCPGGNLAAKLKRSGPRPPAEALRLVLDALAGLDYAHAAGVVHRDMKPHNMLLTETGSVKLSDFGIARDDQYERTARLTGTGDTLGTLAYMAPEQRVDPRKAGPTADIYGVGASLYILVTGRRPFDLALAGLDPSVLERVPSEMRSVVRTAVAHRTSDRYPSARAMAAAVAECLELIDPEAPPAATSMEAFGADEALTVHDETAR